MCVACLIARASSDLLYCGPCAEELAENLTRLIGKPFEDLAFWEMVKNRSSN